MKKTVVLFLIASFCFMRGISDDETPVKDSEDMVQQTLAGMGVLEKLDEKQQRIIVMGSGVAGYDYCFDNDFSCDPDDDFETKRFKAMWLAYSQGLFEIAMTLKRKSNRNLGHETDNFGCFDNEVSITNSTGKVIGSQKRLEIQCELSGFSVVTMAESLGKDGACQVTVALCQSRKWENAYLCDARGEKTLPGKYSLSKWIQRNTDNGMICPQLYCDNEGDWWRVAGVPVSVDGVCDADKLATVKEKAKHYAFEFAMRTMAVCISYTQAFTTYNVTFDGGVKAFEGFTEKAHVKPLSQKYFTDRAHVKWFEFVRTNSLTGKPICMIVCAVRDKGVLTGEKSDDGIRFTKDMSEQKKEELWQWHYEVGRCDTFKRAVQQKKSYLKYFRREIASASFHRRIEQKIKPIEGALSELEEELREKRVLSSEHCERIGARLVEISRALEDLDGEVCKALEEQR